ncbi:hypothetical protein P8T85_00825 [Corynebacterium rouxii]|uniref:Uncharacterized protein n=1 Tax=Corynebacterium rouxii TaxID=2719119 RepID=A0ABU3PJJ7_9CORY|nr:hypothetical protein [Corynebacterium rouxii]MDT9407766.1 hypothetical protein [Corynebacterium rouxii]MDT9409947.1 hypothetical protein [Corynebacterium rouxii]
MSTTITAARLTFVSMTYWHVVKAAEVTRYIRGFVTCSPVSSFVTV